MWQGAKHSLNGKCSPADGKTLLTDALKDPCGKKLASLIRVVILLAILIVITLILYVFNSFLLKHTLEPTHYVLAVYVTCCIIEALRDKILDQISDYG